MSEVWEQAFQEKGETMKQFKPLTEQYREYLKQTPKKGGRPFSEVYIKNICYEVDRIPEPITLQSVNQFIKDTNLHPSMSRSLGNLLIWMKYGNINISKEKRKRITDKLYTPSIKPKKYMHSQKVLSEEEVQKLFGLPIKHSAVFRLMYDTMLRKAELLNSTVENIDWLNNMITLPKIKGGDSDIRFFNNETKQALILYMATKEIATGYLFNFSPSGFWQLINRIGMRTLGRKFNPHWMRTTSAQHARDNGADDFSLMQLGGWKNRATLDVYTRSSVATRRIAFEKFKLHNTEMIV